MLHTFLASALYRRKW